MKIFLSWSGPTSKQAALILRDWLPTVLPFVEPWVSSKDVPKGGRWIETLGVELEDANFGIICTVPDNFKKPWLNFEAGAISKLGDAKVAPLLFGGLSNEEVAGPLTQFQTTQFNREDFFELLKTINKIGGNAIDSEKLINSFNMVWDSLEQKIGQIEFGVKSSEPGERELDDEQIGILKYLAEIDDYATADLVADVTGMSVQRTKFHLDELSENSYVRVSMGYETLTEYALKPKGRAVLFRLKLLD